MSLYFFHLCDGEDVLLDPEGQELGSLDDVRLKTIADARSIIASDALDGTIRLDYRIDVQDDSGAVVHSLDFEAAVTLVRDPKTAP